MVNFLLKKIFRGNLSEVISLTEIDVTFKVVSNSTDEIASFRFPRKIFLQRKSTITLNTENQREYLPAIDRVGFYFLQFIRASLFQGFSLKMIITVYKFEVCNGVYLPLKLNYPTKLANQV